MARSRTPRVSRDLKTALLIVWFALTLPTAASVLASAVLSDRAIAAITPVCQSKRLYGRECMLCGTTTAFIAISHGEWEHAAESNRGAIPLYLCFATNAVAAAVVAGRRVTSQPRMR